MVDIHSYVVRKENTCVCAHMHTHVCMYIHMYIYNCTQQIYILTRMQKYIQVLKVYHHYTIGKFNCLNVLTRDT